MTAVVFLGPSLSLAKAQRICDAVYLPPAAQGDLYRAVREYRPRVVALIDGYFRQLPSVWHKEILWAMHEGVQVLGGASMGALRAAELEAFGMEGIGRIFDAYRCGRFVPFDTAFEDDDEVAVVHGPGEVSYLSASVAMVNLRATLAQAAEAGIIGTISRDHLALIAKATFYPQRSYRQLLADAAGQEELDAAELAALEAWLPDNQIDLKGQDCRAVLERTRQLAATDVKKEIDFHFEHTDLWQGLIEERPPQAETAVDPVLTQLRLDPERYARSFDTAHCRALALAEAERRGLQVSNQALTEAGASLRQARGLYSGGSFQAWLSANGIDRSAFGRLLADELRISMLRRELDPHLETGIIDGLMLNGEYAALSEQASRRAEMTADQQIPAAGSEAYRHMIGWYFETRLRHPVPVDISAYALSLGFADLAAFADAVWGAWLDRGSDDDRVPQYDGGTNNPLN